MINPEVDFSFNMAKVPELPLVYRGVWKIPGGLSYFAGHFPGNPILPAVGLQDGSLEAVKRILKAQSLPSDLEFHSLRSAKFTQSITSGDEVELTATETLVQSPQGQSSRWRVEWKLLPERKVAADLIFEVRSRSQVSHQ
ncbi:MAG: hypothetical protein H7222_09420 [Methylotenera sp.]|nr:hypothetical protein [Oligoflexia bacterium]